MLIIPTANQTNKEHILSHCKAKGYSLVAISFFSQKAIIQKLGVFKSLKCKCQGFIARKINKKLISKYFFLIPKDIFHYVSAIGIDLSTDYRKVGICLTNGDLYFPSRIFCMDDILNLCVFFKPKVVAIDSPLTFPIGFPKVKVRAIEREMYKRKLRVFPFFKTMVMLARAGIKLRKMLEEQGFKVIEVHPLSTAKLLKITCKLQNKHIRDAYYAAVTGELFLQGQTEKIGSKQEGYLYLPRYDDFFSTNK
jgi:predicted nuclease with RNAse H fold